MRPHHFPADKENQQRIEDPAATIKEPHLESEQSVVPENHQDNFIGTTIAGRYEILDLAGRGGMSVVYRARHISTQKIVALKLMHSHLLLDENAVRRFQQEARAAGRLHHPNAISVQDLGVTDDGQPFLTMDYLNGRSLSDEIRFCKKIAPQRCLHIFSQVCSALAHAHDQRIIHRDLKPSNVMLISQDEDSDYVKVVDFGIAKIMMEGAESLKLTATGDVFGSPYYMSPEQCMGNQLDPRSDIYSMGCLMYEALTGRVPHEGKNVLETMYKHTNLAAPTLSEIEADPRTLFALDHILQKCLAKVPEQRYQSMVELRDDLAKVSAADKKGLKLAAQLGMGAADKGRRLDNRLASLSSRKLFWVAVPLLLVLSSAIFSISYYWISTSGDPSPSDRWIIINRNLYKVDDTEDKLIAKVDQNTDDASEQLKKLGESEEQHEFNRQLFHQLSHNSHTIDPRDYYLGVKRRGFYFTRNCDYEDAIEAFNLAMETSSKNGFTNKLDNAYMHAAIAQCLMGAGKASKSDSRLRIKASHMGSDPLEQALMAYDEFKEGNLSSEPPVMANLGNLLELISMRPDKLKSGIPFLQELLEKHKMSPVVEGVAFAQAAQFAASCAENHIDSLPLMVLNQVTQMKSIQSFPTLQIEQECLNKSLLAWQELEDSRFKRFANYNEGVIYNRLGLLAQQNENLNAAEQNFELALNKLAEANNLKDESVAKVLFNLSDVQLKQHNLTEYYKNHRDAKRIWDDTFHLEKKTSGV